MSDNCSEIYTNTRSRSKSLSPVHYIKSCNSSPDLDLYKRKKKRQGRKSHLARFVPEQKLAVIGAGCVGKYVLLLPVLAWSLTVVLQTDPL